MPATGTSFATVQTVDNTPIRVSYGTADTGRRHDERLAAPHRRRGAGLGVRPAGRRHPGHDRPDRHLLGPHQLRGPAGAARHDADRSPVGGTVPATLALTLGAPADLPAPSARAWRRTTRHVDRRQRDLHGRRRDAERRRPERRRPRGLVNGTFALAQPVQAKATRRRRRDRVRAGRGPATTLLDVRGPVSNDAVHDRLQAVDRRQRAAAHRQLRQDAHVHTLHDEP